MIKRILKHVNQHNRFTQQIVDTTGWCGKPFFIDVGGSGFRAVSVWIMAHLLAVKAAEKGILLNTRWVSQLFERHIRYFPIHLTIIETLMESNHAKMQVLSDRLKCELIDTLTYTLGRIAFDELCENPVLYRGAFSHGQTERLRDFMYEFLPKPDKYSMGALARALQLPITIWYVNACNDLPACYQYTFKKRVLGSDVHSGPVLQLQSETYFMPLVCDHTWEKILNHPIQSLLKPVAEHITCRFTLAELHAKLAAADDAIIDEFIHIRARLVAMVQAGDLTLHDVKKIYCKGLDASSQQSLQIGMEWGTQRYFENIAMSRGRMVMTASELGGYDDEMMNQLLVAIARSVSLGEMSLDLIDSYL